MSGANPAYHMDRALVAVYPIEGIEWLVAEAGRLAGGVGADLIVLYARSEAEYEEDRRAVEDVMALESSTYDVGQAAEGAEQVAVEIADAALADVDVDYRTLGAVGDSADRVLSIAEERDCDHVFIPGRRRSPTGKAIFGDTAQQVVLNFEGPVTVVTHPLTEL